MKDKSVLVTGGAGFIGSHLVDRLLALGAEVFVLDNLSSGTVANLSNAMRHSKMHLQRGDVEAPPGPMPTVSLIFHLAACASPVRYQQDPVKTITTNVIGTRNMLELAQQSNARLVLASTSEVYGDPTVHPQPETYRGDVNPIGPRSCYDEGKRCAESLAFAYARSRGVAIRVARIFNTYGPRMDTDDGRVVSNLIVQALRGEPLTLYGDGTHTRSFCYVDDMVEGLLRLAAADHEGPINLGNPQELSILELAERVRRLTGSRAPLVFKRLPEDDPRRRCPSIERAESMLGWQPQVALDEGLAHTIAHFRAVLQTPAQREVA